MLIVGLDVLNELEEQFHFGMWAMNKSPLVIGAPINAGANTSASSIAIMGNKEVVALNQDALGQQTRLIRRYTEEGWDVWAGNLTGGRMVVGLANWNAAQQTVTLDLVAHLGLASVGAARDLWAAKDLGALGNTYNTTLLGHQLQLLVISGLVPANKTLQGRGYYTAATNATLAGNSSIVACTNSTRCAPAGAKVTNMGTASFSNVVAGIGGTHTLGVDYINYDVALGAAWSGGVSIRNMTVSVNGNVKRWEWPISGGDWFDTGRLAIDTDGWLAGGNNTVIFAAAEGPAPDLVGFELFELGTKCPTTRK
jgi:alpha-galactosidase